MSATTVPAPRTIDEVRLQANITRRAETLWQDGYRMKASEEYPGVYLIFRPGSEICDYAVDLNNGVCLCKSFEHHKTCKHYLAVRDEIDRNAAMVAQFEEMGGADFVEWRRAAY